MRIFEGKNKKLQLIVLRCNANGFYSMSETPYTNFFKVAYSVGIVVWIGFSFPFGVIGSVHFSYRGRYGGRVDLFHRKRRLFVGFASSTDNMKFNLLDNNERLRCNKLQFFNT